MGGGPLARTTQGDFTLRLRLSIQESCGPCCDISPLAIVLPFAFFHHTPESGRCRSKPSVIRSSNSKTIITPISISRLGEEVFANYANHASDLCNRLSYLPYLYLETPPAYIMPAHKRRGPIPRRRRHDDDDGEEDASLAGDTHEYASSEGSATTDAEDDGEMSVVSADDAVHSTPSPIISKQHSKHEASREHQFKITADTEAMLNGLKLGDGETVEELDFEDPVHAENLDASPPPSQPAVSHKKLQPVRAGRPASQTVLPSRKSYFAAEDRPRHQAYVGQSGYRGRGRGFPETSTRGYVPTDSLVLSY